MKPDDIRLADFDIGTSRAPIRVTWLGTAGFMIEHDGFTLLIDPYVTRATLFECLRAPIRSNLTAVRRYTPKADAIVAGHTHFDHMLDVPAIAKLTGAKVYGSRSCANLCRLEGVPEEQVVDVESMRSREPVRADVGPFELRFIPSCHSAMLMGRVFAPGDISDCDQLPMPARSYRCGAVFGVDVRVAGKRLYHVGSADLLDGYPERDVDLALMCVAGWRTSERFPQRVMGSLRPGAILLSHWDNFFSPMHEGAKMLPRMQMPRLVEDLSAVDPSVKIGTLPILGDLVL